MILESLVIRIENGTLVPTRDECTDEDLLRPVRFRWSFIQLDFHAPVTTYFLHAQLLKKHSDFLIAAACEVIQGDTRLGFRPGYLLPRPLLGQVEEGLQDSSINVFRQYAYKCIDAGMLPLPHVGVPNNSTTRGPHHPGIIFHLKGRSLPLSSSFVKRDIGLSSSPDVSRLH